MNLLHFWRNGDNVLDKSIRSRASLPAFKDVMIEVFTPNLDGNFEILISAWIILDHVVVHDLLQVSGRGISQGCHECANSEADYDESQSYSEESESRSEMHFNDGDGDAQYTLQIESPNKEERARIEPSSKPEFPPPPPPKMV